MAENPKYPVTRLACAKCGHEFGIMLEDKLGIEHGVVCPKCHVVGSSEKKEKTDA